MVNGTMYGGERGLKKKFLIITLVVLFLFSTLSSALSIYNSSKKLIMVNRSVFTMSLNDGPYFVWEDDFDDMSKIDLSPPGQGRTENFVVENGEVKIMDTYPAWTDPSWTRMKPITIRNKANTDLTQYAVKLVVKHDQDMKDDYSDLRFKYENEDYWLNYWIESRDPDPNNRYAIVWVKVPSIPRDGTVHLYMFYGNKNAGDMSDFWSVFNEDSWSKKWAHDERVTQHAESEGAWDPDVAYGSGRFLVAWEEGTVMPMDQEIRGQIFNSKGDVVVRDFDIGNQEKNIVHQENPSVAYGNGKFFVAWQQCTVPGVVTTSDIYGAIVDTNGNVLKKFVICDENNCQADPCVAFDSSNKYFFVVWEDARNGMDNYNVYGKIFDTSGNQVGGEKAVCTDANSQTEPWIAFDNVNNHFLIVWEEGVTADKGPFSLYARLFDSDGNPIGSKITVAIGNDSVDYNFPCVAFCEETQRFLITWNDDDISSNDWWGNIWGMIVDKNGNKVKDMFLIHSGNFVRTGIAPYLSTAFFVSYDGNGEIWGKLVSSDGELLTTDALQLSDSESSPADWANIAVGDDRIFISWEDTRVVYPPPWNNNPDVYCNIWYLNIPAETDISYTIGEEKKLVLNAYITSVTIKPDVLRLWHEFNAVYSGEITFNILDENGHIIKSDVSSGENLDDISNNGIRLMACLSRANPSSTPVLDKWNVTYLGEDNDSPNTVIKDINGEEGENGWYISSVQILLESTDGVQGVGVDKIYYSLNNEQPRVYDENTGIILPEDENTLYGTWVVKYWAVDKVGNIENQHSIEIKIDKENPYIEITEPPDKDRTKGAFWVRTNPLDHGSGIWKVEFDTGTPFNNPITIYEPPWEWYCDRTYLKGWHYIQVVVYDYAGNTYKDTIQVYFDNRKDKSFENRVCLLLVTGTGAISQQAKNNKVESKSIFYSEIEWEFTEGTSLSIGLQGIHSLQGAQQGMIRNFLGLVTYDETTGLYVIIGGAAYIEAKLAE